MTSGTCSNWCRPAAGWGRGWRCRRYGQPQRGRGRIRRAAGRAAQAEPRMTGPDRARGAHSAAEDAEREAPGLSALEEQAVESAQRDSPDALAGQRVVSPLADADERGNRVGAVEQERLVSPLADADERAIEGALRPKRLAEVIGQTRVR